MGWERLVPAQQYLLEALGIEPPADGEAVVPVRRSQEERWNTNLAAARQFHTREGHLRPARKHIELIDDEEIKLGAFQDNARCRAARLSPERRAALDTCRRTSPELPSSSVFSAYGPVPAHGPSNSSHSGADGPARDLLGLKMPGTGPRERRRYFGSLAAGAGAVCARPASSRSIMRRAR
ncbi:helicase associated domain-containing protein [Streptomyces sp. NPDC002701]|uniref:helicase associated domain-containing protein n=1 Tax=Streptomyces sp. NPDC002701 TaxID=3364661 RepID=UPI0036921A11